MVVNARKWIEFARLLAPIVTNDLDAVAERLKDESSMLNARNEQQRRGLAKTQLFRAGARLEKARKHQREVRDLLLLDEEPDGLP